MPSRSCNPPDRPAATAGDEFLSRLEHEVTRPFSRHTGLTVVTFLMDWPSPRGEAKPIRVPVHPECADRSGDLACRRSWEEHLPHLRERPEVYSHRCPYGKLCATVPAVFKGRCIAASKLVCYADMPEPEFDRAVEHLDALTEAFVRRESAWVAELMGVPAPAAPARPQLDGVEPAARPPAHRHVGQALRHIRDKLSDSKLRVNTVAEALSLDSDHLSHLFSVQTGFHMGWFIMAERMDLAAKLLLIPGRQRVQDIVPQVGYTNRAWFSHAFRLHTGVPPTQFRRRSRA